MRVPAVRRWIGAVLVTSGPLRELPDGGGYLTPDGDGPLSALAVGDTGQASATEPAPDGGGAV
jgi:hypothetical protein